MGLEEFVEYLVIRRLADDTAIIIATKEYLLENLSPSVISYKYGISKVVLRNYIKRAIDKAGNHRSAAKFMNAVFFNILSLEPIILSSNNSSLCIVCGRYMRSYGKVKHVAEKHLDVVRSAVELVLNGAARLVG